MTGMRCWRPGLRASGVRLAPVGGRYDFRIRRTHVARHHLSAAVVAALLDHAPDLGFADAFVVEPDDDRAAQVVRVGVVDPRG